MEETSVLTFFLTRWEMSDTAAVGAWPLEEAPLVWVENRAQRSGGDTTHASSMSKHRHRLTLEVAEESPFCGAEPGNAEEVEPPS